MLGTSLKATYRGLVKPVSDAEDDGRITPKSDGRSTWAELGQQFLEGLRTLLDGGHRHSQRHWPGGVSGPTPNRTQRPERPRPDPCR